MDEDQTYACSSTMILKDTASFFHRPSPVIIPIYIVLHCKICNLISFCTPVFNYDPSPSVSPGDALHSLRHVQKEYAVHHLAC